MKTNTIGKICKSPTGKATALAAALALIVLPQVAAATPTGGGDTVRSFYYTLLATMKDGRVLGESGRYARLAPVVRRTFDVPFMTRIAVGPSWAALTPAQQRQAIAAFGRYISAMYADRFDSYSGEKLLVTGEQPYAAGMIVKSRIVTADGKPVDINYMMRRHDNSWQISDVYLDGTISELATHRAEFAAILQREGIEGLIAALNRKADRLSAGVANAS